MAFISGTHWNRDKITYSLAFSQFKITCTCASTAVPSNLYRRQK